METSKHSYSRGSATIEASLILPVIIILIYIMIIFAIAIFQDSVIEARLNRVMESYSMELAYDKELYGLYQMKKNRRDSWIGKVTMGINNQRILHDNRSCASYNLDISNNRLMLEYEITPPITPFLRINKTSKVIDVDIYRPCNSIRNIELISDIALRYTDIGAKIIEIKSAVTSLGGLND